MRVNAPLSNREKREGLPLYCPQSHSSLLNGSGTSALGFEKSYHFIRYWLRGLDSSFKSFCRRVKAVSKASWSFQLERSGMKYSRTSTAKSLPVSASKQVQSRKVSKFVSRIGKSLRRFSFFSV